MIIQDRFKFRAYCQFYNGEYGYVYFDVNKGLQEVLGDDFVKTYVIKIEQCTGLKDKNGKLIFEGDIVVFYGMVYEVVWDNEFSRFSMKRNEFHSFNIDVYKCEVIGNIHENPELLEVQDER